VVPTPKRGKLACHAARVAPQRGDGVIPMKIGLTWQSCAVLSNCRYTIQSHDIGCVGAVRENGSCPAWRNLV